MAIRKTCRFNLPGRFGFGRTPDASVGARKRRRFQSARQIWVWPNAAQSPCHLPDARVSICQADLGLAEPCPRNSSCRSGNRFNLPGRFGFGRTPVQLLNTKVDVPSFNLPGRFGFGRTSRSWRCWARRTSFNLPGRFGFGRTHRF